MPTVRASLDAYLLDADPVAQTRVRKLAGWRVVREGEPQLSTHTRHNHNRPHAPTSSVSFTLHAQLIYALPQAQQLSSGLAQSSPAAHVSSTPEPRAQNFSAT